MVGLLTDRQVPFFSNKISFSDIVKRVLKRALTEAFRHNCQSVSTEHVLLSIVLEGYAPLNNILVNYGLNYYTIRDEIKGTQAQQRARGMKTPLLDEFGVNLNQMALEDRLDPLIGREDELERIVQILCRRNKNNPILVGEPGVGKSAIVEGLAQRIVKNQVPDAIRDSIITSLDLGSLVAGTKYRGQFEERVKKLMKEVQKMDNIIIFIDEIHTIVGAGAAEGSLDASSLLKPALARGQFQCIGATTPEEYRRYFEKDGSLDRRFQAVWIKPPSKELTINILKGLKHRYEDYHNVRIQDGALHKAVELSDKFIMYRNQPDKAIDVLDEACSRVRLQFSKFPKSKMDYQYLLGDYEKKLDKANETGAYDMASKWQDRLRRLKRFYACLKHQEGSEALPDVTEEDIEYIVSKSSGIPVYKIEESEKDKLLRMEDELHRFIVGQDQAVKRVSDAVRRARSGIYHGKRPLGSFMFLGPTGVGKTELAKVLAEFLFGSKEALIRVDMSEYMEKYAVSRLIGSPPGYVGYEDGGQITKKIKQRPYSVILLDEIEKAHPDVFNLLLQIFEEGELTDSLGNRVSFKNTIVIMTSNIGAKRISKSVPLGFSQHTKQTLNFREIEQVVKGEVKNHFSPEFLNRLDEIIVFHPLTEEHILRILEIQQRYINESLQHMKLIIELSPEAKHWLTQKGFSATYGARPLRRVLQKHLEDPLAKLFLSKKVKPGDKLLVSVREDNLHFSIIDKDIEELVKASVLT